MSNSSRRLPPCGQLQTFAISADSAPRERLRATGIDVAIARETVALRNFERCLKEMSDASVRMIDAVVDLRDARAAVQTT